MLHTRTKRTLQRGGMLSCSIAIAYFVSFTSAQLNYGVPGTVASTGLPNGLSNQLCNKTFAHANATDYFSFNPNIDANSSPYTYAGVIYQSNYSDEHDNSTASSAASNRIELSLWLSDGRAPTSQEPEDDQDLSLGYSSCYFWPVGLSSQATLNGQSDNGTCLSTMDSDCIRDFVSATNRYSGNLTGIPTGLNASSLPGLCTTIAALLTENFPASCTPFFNATANNAYTVFGGSPALGGPLTGENSLLKTSKCHNTQPSQDDPSQNTTYSLLWTQYGAYSLPTYYAAHWFVVPLITAFFPIADANRQVTLGAPKAFMTCGRAKNVAPGSLDVPQAKDYPAVLESLPGAVKGNSSVAMAGNGTASQQDGGSVQLGTGAEGVRHTSLSPGVIAGIAVAAAVAVALLALAVWYLCFFRKKRKISHSPRLAPDEHDSVIDSDQKRLRQSSVEAPMENSIMEMSNRNSRLGQTTYQYLAELPTSRNPAELPSEKY